MTNNECQSIVVVDIEGEEEEGEEEATNVEVEGIEADMAVAVGARCEIAFNQDEFSEIGM
jgi:hypothetical protein